jgi:hypothetical protein
MNVAEKDRAALVGALEPRGAPEPRRPRFPPLLMKALAALNAAGLPYCYWKQTAKLESVLAGRSDLDLLIERRARDSFFAVMQAQGFKAWPDAGALTQPEFVSFLGYDETSGLILHVHAHFRLVLGDALSKAFHVPIEDKIISRSRMDEAHPVRVLDPVDEALLLRLRRALEGGPLDATAWGRSARAGASPESASPVPFDEAAMEARAATFLSEEVAHWLATTDLADIRARGGLRAKLRRDLKPWRLRGRVSNVARLVFRTAYLTLSVLNRRFLRAPRLPRRPAPGGGALIAILGVDGSGKSTQVAETRRWLGSEIDVFASYFGTGDGAASLLFRPIKAVAEAIGARVRVKPKGASHGRVSDRPPGPLYSLMFCIWAVAVALDKRAKLAAARRAVARGFVVVTDRYPQNEIPFYNDGPLLHRIPAAPAWLRKFERSVYEDARRFPPDLVVKLHVGAATVARREPEMRADLIQQRIDWLKELSCGGANSVSIDASLPLAEVTRLVRRAVWNIL